MKIPLAQISEPLCNSLIKHSSFLWVISLFRLTLFFPNNLRFFSLIFFPPFWQPLFTENVQRDYWSQFVDNDTLSYLSTQKTIDKYKTKASITSFKIFQLRFKHEKIIKGYKNKYAWRVGKPGHISNWWQQRVNIWCFLQLDRTIKNNSLSHFSLL